MCCRLVHCDVMCLLCRVLRCIVLLCIVWCLSALAGLIFVLSAWHGGIAIGSMCVYIVGVSPSGLTRVIPSMTHLCIHLWVLRILGHMHWSVPIVVYT